MRRAVRLTVIGNSRAPACDANCGVDWSRPEAIAHARQALKERFGDRVQIRYISEDPAAKPERMSYPYPRLTVDGEIRLARQFDLRQMLDVAETQLEMAVTE